MRCVSLEHERVTSTRLILEASQEKEKKEEKEEEEEAMAVEKKCSYFSLFHFQGIPITCLRKVILLSFDFEIKKK